MPETPSTEDVRRDYATRMAPASDSARRKLFDAWLAAHDREVAAKALEETAHALAEFGDESQITVGDPDDEDTWVTLTIHEWLDARADRIGAGDE